ncbi:MAG: AarF/UbiB family protein, partial [Candidatus Pacebacteria bacterium]|nr:AarF/UbiB family protein [Candidatus Paceibacterota bacterium]
MAKIKNTYRNIKRSREILEVFMKHGMGYVFDLPQVEKYLNVSERIFLKKREDKKIIKLTLPERFRLALEELGPTFIKLGQVLSTHPDLIDPDFIKELSKLQDKVRHIPTPIIKKQLEAEFKKPVSELFLSFSERPIATAS